MMEYNKDSFILGEPIKTEVGTIRFLKYREYIHNLPELSLMAMNTLHIYYYNRNQYDKKFQLDDPEIIKFLSDLKSAKLIEIILSDRIMLESYIKIFSLVIDNCDEELLEMIFRDEELFMRVRDLILSMQMLSESEVSPNEEIQSFIDASREIKQQEAEKQTYSDILSTIVVGTGIDYDIVLNWNVLRVYATFYRISAFKNSDVTALFATVTDKVQFETWQKHIDLFEKEKAGMKMSEFNKKFGSLFSK